MAGGLSTFESLYKGLLLRCPSASVFLARSWIDFAFRYFWDYKLWSWQRKKSQFLMSQQTNAGFASATFGSANIVGTGTAWTGALVSQQFRIGITTPIYTIIAVTDATHLTISEPWGGPTTTNGNYSIYNAYVTPPTDFQNFICVIDPNFNWQLETNVTQEELNAWDAQRANTGTAYVVATLDFSGLFQTPPVPRYEIWPHQRAQYVYPFWYLSRPPDLSEPGASLPRMIRGDVILEGALANAARWPGETRNTPNPYFNLALANEHEDRFQKMCLDLARTDDELMENDVSYMSLSAMPFASIPWGDARYLQSHEF